MKLWATVKNGKWLENKLEETHIAEDGNIKFVEEEKENADSNFLDIKKWFKTLEGKISMRFAMSREIWYWD